MPLYEYHCEPCNLTFESLIRSDGEEARCPQCNSIEVHKQLSVPATAQTMGGHMRGLLQATETGGLALLGCGRPQCGVGTCVRLE